MQAKTRTVIADKYAEDKRRRRQIRSWLILLLVIALVFFGVRTLTTMGRTTEIAAWKMPCFAAQNVTVFGNNVLYYDGASVHCLSSTGSIQWSFPVGGDASFSVSKDHIAIWSGSQLFIVDQYGHASYNDNMDSNIQFARIGDRYCAIVIGDSTNPDLVVKDMKGLQIDEEMDAYSGMLLLDVGFFGDQGQYMWTLALDVYSTAINTVMNTFQVGKMNTGEVDLGEYLAYAVLFENEKLHVFTTQQMYNYDYKAVQDVNSTMLVYGWKLVDYDIPSRGNAAMLMVPTSQQSSTQLISDLRLLQGTLDRRYTLPTKCLGAAVRSSYLYAVSADYLYRCKTDSQRFYAYALPLENDLQATEYIGITDDYHLIIASGDSVYSVSMPQ